MKYILFSLLLLAGIAGQAQQHRLHPNSKQKFPVLTVDERQSLDFVADSTVHYDSLRNVERGIVLYGHPHIPDTALFLYDTIKVIAEVYQLPERVPDAIGFMVTDTTNQMLFAHLRYDSGWKVKNYDPYQTAFYKDPIVGSYKVLAWEVWRKGVRLVNYGYSSYLDAFALVPVERVKTLSYNRKDELTHVLQSWRVEW